MILTFLEKKNRKNLKKAENYKMKSHAVTLCLFLTFMSCGSMYGFDAPTHLVNPGFEEDKDNVGFPDGWTVAPDALVTLNRENPASGSRALEIQEGYAAVYQNLNIENLANRKVAVTLAARSSDGGRLGVRFGYFVYDEAKEKKWVDAVAIWDKLLDSEYQTITASRVMPEDALDGRFWICIYRSQREGTIIVDDITLDFIDEQSSLAGKQAVVALREVNYLRGKLNRAKGLQPENPAWTEIQQAMDVLLSSPEQTFDGILEQSRKLNADILVALYPDSTFTATLQEPYQRIEAGQLPAQKEREWGVIALRGETAALSVEVANTTGKLQTLMLSFEETLAADIQMRRQVFMETWYTKGETLLADPLTLLREEKGTWFLDLEPGEITRVHVSLKIAVDAKAVRQFARLIVRGGEEQKILPFELETLSAKAPETPQLAHYQFLYTNMNVVHDLPEKACRDLEAHGVTDIEWPFMPTAKFLEDGGLQTVSWGNHDRWLAGFRDSAIRLNIFWEGSYKRMQTVNGGELEPGSKEWSRALQELLSAYLDHAETLGLPRERFTILPMDEIHSTHLDNAPDGKVFLYRDLAEKIFEAETELTQYLTIGNYAFPQDVEVVLPRLDVAMPHWPMPEKLSRNAPPDYNPRKAYFEKTLPMLEKARQERGLKIWSYHVLRGKSSDVLQMSRAYPLLAVASGYTGFAYWAYNVSSGSTWDDQDGTILDYCLIYDGRENHLLNRKYNITAERIVPSIQWEAIRAGQQDGQILLYLQHRLKEQEYPQQLRSEIEALLLSVRELGGQEGYGSDALSFADVREFATRLRQVYLKTLESGI